MADLYIEVWYRGREDELAGIDTNCICVKIRKVIGIHPSDAIACAIKELTQRQNLVVRSIYFFTTSYYFVAFRQFSPYKNFVFIFLSIDNSLNHGDCQNI